MPYTHSRVLSGARLALDDYAVLGPEVLGGSALLWHCGAVIDGVGNSEEREGVFPPPEVRIVLLHSTVSWLRRSPGHLHGVSVCPGSCWSVRGNAWGVALQGEKCEASGG